MIYLQIIGFIACIVLAAWGYRFGGSSNGIRFVREMAVAVAEILALTILFGWNWWSLGIMGTAWGMTSYFKKKGTDAKWWNWMLVGVVFAVMPLPQVIAMAVSGHPIWHGFLLRAAFIIPFTTIWCTFFGGNVQWSEGMRGGIQILSLLFLRFIK